MNDVPLVKGNNVNDINTSIIAIKKQLKQLNEAVGLIDIPDMPDLSPYVKKSDVVNSVESGNLNPVTSNAVANNKVDSVTSGNMLPVTSNAVSSALGGKVNASDVVNSVIYGNMNPVTSNGVANLFRATDRALDNDVNKAIAVGTYSINPDTLHTPITDYGTLLVYGKMTETPATNSQWINQILIYTNAEIYFRQSINANSTTPSNWTSWIPLYKKNRVTYYTGVGMEDADITKTITIADKSKCNIATLNIGNSIVDTVFIVSSPAVPVLKYTHPAQGYVYISVEVIEETADTYKIKVTKAEDAIHQHWDIVFWTLS